MAWRFATSDALAQKLWREEFIRDAEKFVSFMPYMYAPKSPKTIRHPDAGKTQGIIKVHTDFQAKKGDRLTLPNIARLTGRGVHGDGMLAGTGLDVTTYSMNIFFENVATQVRSEGELSDQRVGMEFRASMQPELGSWAGRKLDEAVILHLWGLTTWNNTPFDNWDNAGETSVFGNTIQAFDANHIVRAGDATSTATIGADDRMGAQLLTKIQTTAMDDLDIPLEPLDIDGQKCLIAFMPYRHFEDLTYDEDYREAQASNVRGSDNPLIKGAQGKFGNIYIIPIQKSPTVAANVSRTIVCGKDALQLAKVRDWRWWEGFEDSMNRRAVIAIGGFFGMAATYLNASRRNAIAVDAYSRS